MDIKTSLKNELIEENKNAKYYVIDKNGNEIEIFGYENYEKFLKENGN